MTAQDLIDRSIASGSEVVVRTQDVDLLVELEGHAKSSRDLGPLRTEFRGEDSEGRDWYVTILLA